jgi:hypothetical protein
MQRRTLYLGEREVGLFLLVFEVPGKCSHVFVIKAILIEVKAGVSEKVKF